MFQCLSPRTCFPIFLPQGWCLSKEKQVPLGGNRNTVCLLSSPPNNYYKTLKYDKLHWNKNIVSFDTQILTKIRQSEIKIYHFNIGFSNYCIKMHLHIHFFTSYCISPKAGPAIGQLILHFYCMGLLQRKIYKMHLLTLTWLSLRLPFSRHINWSSGYVLLWNFTNIYR